MTVLADRSDGYSDVVLVWAVALAFTAMSLFAVIPQPFMDLWDSLVGGWMHEWTTGELASMTIALGLVAFTLGWLLLSWDPLRFALTPGPVKSARVHSSAIRHFKVGAEQRTHGRTGVLLYLSMREHRAEIGPPAGAFGIAFAECARDHRIDADHDPDAEARKRDGDREDETHRSEFLRAELADEIGVDQADRHDCRNAEDHRQRLSHQMAADTAAG